MPEACKICKLNAPVAESVFCAECKNPKQISGFCQGCGHRFTVSAEQLQKIIDRQPELLAIKPAPGLSITVSQCRICKKPNTPTTLKIF